MGSVLFVMVFVILLGNQNHHIAEGTRTIVSEEDMEVERQLKILNKPPIKTIQTESGDIIDCIDIHKQPAFDHPLLKDHKIQMKPVLAQEESTNKINNASRNEVSFEIPNEKCPQGTVPIRRTTKEDLTNWQHPLRKIKSYPSSQYPPAVALHVVSIEPLDANTYNGGQAVMSVSNPKLQPDQFSGAQIWVQNGPSNELNSIEFGWTVYPSISGGDTHTRVFGYWTADGYGNTGCFNMLCSGFVQIHDTLTLGSIISPTSVSGGEQRLIKFSLARENEHGNWWLSIEDQSIGYWPSNLFSHLSKQATVVRYGAVAGAGTGKPTPPMGNGNFPESDYSKTCYMKNMKVIDKDGQLQNFDDSRVKLVQDPNPNCYLLRYLGYVDKDYDIAMMFGGPGGQCPA